MNNPDNNIVATLLGSIIATAAFLSGLIEGLTDNQSANEEDT